MQTIEPAPNHIPALAFRGWPDAPPLSPIRAAQHALWGCAADARDARAAYVAARLKLGPANRQTAASVRVCGPFRPGTGPRALALRVLNRCRAACIHAERAEAAARAALDALTAPTVLRLAA